MAKRPGISKKEVLERMRQGESFIAILEGAGHSKGLFFHWRAKDKKFDAEVREIVADRKTRRLQRREHRLEKPIPANARGRKAIERTDDKVRFSIKIFKRVSKRLEEICAST